MQAQYRVLCCLHPTGIKLEDPSCPHLAGIRLQLGGGSTGPSGLILAPGGATGPSPPCRSPLIHSSGSWGQNCEHHWCNKICQECMEGVVIVGIRSKSCCYHLPVQGEPKIIILSSPCTHNLEKKCPQVQLGPAVI